MVERVEAMTQEIGILAFGSLIGDPGPEIAQATVRKIPDVVTPFGVEFARRSDVTRAGAPTVVPVLTGGSPVKAQLIVLNITEQEAKDRLWRRETRRTEGKYTHRPKPGPNTLIIDAYPRVGGVSVALAARLPANIEPLTPEELARLAIESAHKLTNGLDGISYLINVKREGIVTPLMPMYEAEILRRSGARNLEEALAKIHGREKN